MTRGTRHRRGGFTLLEVLVTVTIFALLFAVLMGGWFQAMKAQLRLSAAAQQVQQQQQLTFALRQLLSEVSNPRTGRGTVFNGTRKGFVAESTASLAPRMGASPLPVSLQIEGTSPALQLHIEHPALGGARYPWRLQTAALSYLDAMGRAHDAWPPVYSMVDSATGTAPPLPAMVQLTLQFEGQARPLTVLVAPRASPWQPAEPVSPFELKAE